MLGSRGTVHPDKVRGSVAQEVLRSAAGDTLVVKDDDGRPDVSEVLGELPGHLAREHGLPSDMIHRPEAAPVSLWRQLASYVGRGGVGRDRHARTPG